MNDKSVKNSVPWSVKGEMGGWVDGWMGVDLGSHCPFFYDVL
jgi:hypothetical protein